MGPKRGLATYKLHMVCICTLTPRIPTDKEKLALRAAQAGFQNVVNKCMIRTSGLKI